MKSCKLCKNKRQLVESHIIPKFVFKWMKQTGSRYFRKAKNPNVRTQDGEKSFLLCNECEQLLSTSEKWFATNIFYPYLSNQKVVFEYHEVLSKFLISIMWRILLVSDVYVENNQHQDSMELNNAFEEWRIFLLNGNIPSTYDEIHLLFTPDQWGAEQTNKYVSRYFSRDIDANVIYLEDDCWVYAKFARFMVFGKIKSTKHNFRNTKINFDSGFTSIGQFIDNPDITGYLMDRAEFVYDYFNTNTSAVQLQVINNFIKENYNEIKNSELGKRIVQYQTAIINPDALSSSFDYLCDCCGKVISEPEGYLLRTFEILLSKIYWRDYFHNLQLTTSDEDLKIRLKALR